MTGKNIKQFYKLANRTSEILARPMPTTVGVLPAQLSEDDRKNFRKLYLLIEQLLANPVLTENPAIVTELQILATGLPEIDTTDLVVVDRFEPEDNIFNVANIASLARESISPAPSFSEITVYDSEDDNIDFGELIKSVQRFKLDDDDESYTSDNQNENEDSTDQPKSRYFHPCNYANCKEDKDKDEDEDEDDALDMRAEQSAM